MSDIHKCGFCGLLTGLMRRVMCVGNRRGSNESHYRELGDQDTLRFRRRSGAGHSVFVEEPVDSEPEEERKTFQETLNDILQEEDPIENMTELAKKHNGRFHSFRRRRKKQAAMNDLAYIIDDYYPIKVELILFRCSNWEFDTQDLDQATGGYSLPILGMYLFTGYGLIEYFNLAPERCWKLFRIIDQNYHDMNPYHNSVHAADVTQAMHCFLQEPLLVEFIKPLELMVALLAAITHDLDHPGVNHSFLVATNHPLAIMFKDKSIGMNDRTPLPRRGRRGRKLREMLQELAAAKADYSGLESTPAKPKPSTSSSSNKATRKEEKPPQCDSILEHHHWRVAYSCILESGIFEHMDRCLPEIVGLLKSLILATDITRQNDYLNAFKDLQARNRLDMTRADHRQMVLQMALKTADISNPGRPWTISKKWSSKVCSEFYAQGDRELSLNLPISNLCNRDTETIPKIQTGFFRYVVTPLFTEMHQFLKSDFSRKILTNLVHNEAEWAREDRRSESRTATQSDAYYISDADDMMVDLETSTNISGSSEMLIPGMGSGGLGSQTRVPRRGSHSPVKPIKDAIRRYSAPLQAFCEPRSRSRKKTSIPEVRLREELQGVPTSATIKSDKYMSMLEIAMLVASEAGRNPVVEAVSRDTPNKASDSSNVPQQLMDLKSLSHVLSYAVQVDSDEESNSNGKEFIEYNSIIMEESSSSSASQLTSSRASRQFLLPPQKTKPASAPSSETRLDCHQEEEPTAPKAVASSCEITFVPEKNGDETADLLSPQMSISSLYPRRQSAPAPVAVSDLQRLASTLSLQLERRKQSASSCHQWIAAAEETPAGGMARRGSLPVEVMTGISA